MSGCKQGLRGRNALKITMLTMLAVWCAGNACLADQATEQPAETAFESGPVSVITGGWVDIRQILHNLAEGADLSLQMAPDVQGQVNIHLENTPLEKAIEALCDPLGLAYLVDGSQLVVYKTRMVTRWFNFDYPVTEREGRGELEVSINREGVSGGGGSRSSGEGNQNKSHVTSTATMSIWPQVMDALQVLVFQNSDSIRGAGGGNDQQQAVNLSDAEGRSLVVNPMASLIQVTAETNRVEKVEILLSRMEESLQRQVAIQVRIMEVYLDEDTQTGVNWESLTAGDFEGKLETFSSANHIDDNYFQFVVDGANAGGVFEAIASSGEFKTVSSPRVTTLNNQKAVVRVVSEEVFFEAEVAPAIISNGVATEPVVNYTPLTVPVGVVLDVTPQVGRDGVITLNIHPTISDIIGIAVSPNSDTAPILSIRELDTVGKVQAGQTLVIAGLISERLRHSRTGIPVLKDLPLLGYVFGKTSQEKYNLELVILLTPVLLEGDEADALARADRDRLESMME